MAKGQIAIDTKVVYGIIGLLVLSGGAGVYFLTPDQLDQASTCTTTNITGIFESFSKTNITGYWTDSDGIKKQSVCTKGVWIPTRTWLEINKLTEKDVTIQEIKESPITEENIEIISAVTKSITISSSKQIIISTPGTYNITYTEKPPVEIIKCICEKSTGCLLKECLG